MQINKYNKEVFYVKDQLIEIRRDYIEDLKKKCLHSKNKKARLCMHKDISSLIHEMIIVHTKDTYVRPHKHLNKIESFHVIEGSAKAVIFDEKQNIIKVMALGDYLSGDNFYCRFIGPYYHALIIDSEFFVFHEITNGPFNRADTIFAPWAPADDDKENSNKFMDRISKEADKFLKLKGNVK